MNTEKDWTNEKGNRKKIIITILSAIMVLVVFETIILLRINREKAFQSASLLLIHVETRIFENSASDNPEDMESLVYNIPAYEGVQVIVADKDSKIILGSTDFQNIDLSLDKVVVTPEIKNGEPELGVTFVTRMNERLSYCAMKETLKHYIYVGQSAKVVNRGVFPPVFIVFVYLVTCAIGTTFIIKQMKLNVVLEKVSSNNDQMTGFLNRKAFDRDLAAHPGVPIEECFAAGSIDLNCLKTINETKGSEAGDKLILGAADCIRKVFGPHGKLYRVGGDEFLVILFVDHGKLESLTIEFFNKIKAWNEANEDELSISWGFVRKDEYPGKAVEELFKLADAKMYQHKEIFYTTNGHDRRRR